MSKFFDSLKENAKTVANIACKKTGKAVNYSKLKFNVADINRKISNHYEEIGRALYCSRKEESDKSHEINEHIAAIDNLKMQVESLAREIENLKGEKCCECECTVQTCVSDCNEDSQCKCDCCEKEN